MKAIESLTKHMILVRKAFELYASNTIDYKECVHAIGEIVNNILSIDKKELINFDTQNHLTFGIGYSIASLIIGSTRGTLKEEIFKQDFVFRMAIKYLALGIIAEKNIRWKAEASLWMLFNMDFNKKLFNDIFCDILIKLNKSLCKSELEDIKFLTANSLMRMVFEKDEEDSLTQLFNTNNGLNFDTIVSWYNQLNATKNLDFKREGDTEILNLFLLMCTNSIINHD